MLLRRDFEAKAPRSGTISEKVSIAVWHSRHTRLRFAAVTVERVFNPDRGSAPGERAFMAQTLSAERKYMRQVLVSIVV